MTVDPYGRAIRDHYRGERTAPLLSRDGPDARAHPVDRFYFGEFPADVDDEVAAWLEKRLEGPLLDIGAGAGRHALFFQERFETVAVDVSSHLVETMRDRGVRDARRLDVFDVRDAFERDRFGSILAHGTQIGLSRSMRGLQRLLGDLAFVTTPDATAVVDCYDPDAAGASDLLGYRDDPTPGLAYRVLTFEYEGDMGETLLFRLFGPDRLREATVGTEWTVAETAHDGAGDDPHYRAALAKPRLGE